MKDTADAELLADLARLYKKYGPDVFEQLASRVSSPAFAETLASILKETAHVGRLTKSTHQAEVRRRPPHAEREHGGRITKSTARPSLRKELHELNITNPEKYHLLESFASDIKSRRLLAKVRDIRRFAAENGLPPITAKSHDQAVSYFIRALLPLPLDELTKMLLRARGTQTFNSTLSQWSEIITKGMARSSTSG